MFAHYSQWIPKFSQYVQPLVQVVSFPLPKAAKIALNILKTVLSEATLQPIAEGVPFTVETDASNYKAVKGAILRLKKRHIQLLRHFVSGIIF